MTKSHPPHDRPLTDAELLKEVCRRIRLARAYWDAHNNRACRGEREKALALYQTLTKAQKQQIPEQLRVWLRYRSEKYFGEHRTPPTRSPHPQAPKAQTHGHHLPPDLPGLFQ